MTLLIDTKTASKTRIVFTIESEIREQSLNFQDIVFNFDEFADLTMDRLRKDCPGFVICPLFTLKFDAIDVGKLILGSEVHAKLLIVAPTLPRPNMVLKELLDACPGLTIAFFDLNRWGDQSRLSA